MISDQEHRSLAHIAQQTEPSALRAIAANARGKSTTVEVAALRRLASVSARHERGTVHHACWTMVHAVEELRRLAGRKTWRMNYLRRKIDKDGEISALEYCALKRTDGFSEVLGYGTPELTAEAIVLKFPSQFSEAATASARIRLTEAGVDVDNLLSTWALSSPS